MSARSSTWKGDTGIAAGAAALALLVRLSAVDNGFVWDDHLIIRAFEEAGGFRPDMLFERSTSMPGMRWDFYRPLQILVYGIGWSIGRQEPFAYHVLCVVLHALVAGAVFLYGAALFRAAGRPATAAVWAASVFAVLPIHTQSVAWIAGSADVICALFLLIAARATLCRRSPVCAAGVALGCFGALLAKETGLVALLLLPLQAWLLRPPGVSIRMVSVVVSASVLGLLLYLGLRASAGFAIPVLAESRPTTQVTPFEVFTMVGHCAARLLVPTVPVEWHFTMPQGTWHLLLGVVAIIALAAAMVLLVRADNRVGLVALAWLVLFTLPALSPSAQGKVIMGVHRLYLPSIGWLLLMFDFGVRATTTRRRKHVVGGLAALLIGLLAFISWQGNLLWRDEERFWTNMVSRNPRYAYPLTKLGREYWRQNHLDHATEMFHRAAAGQGSLRDRARALSFVSAIALSRGDVDSACELLDRSLAMYPRSRRTQLNAALCRAGQGQAAIKAGNERAGHGFLQDARARLENLVRASPTDAAFHRHLGDVFLLLGEPASARPHLQSAMRLGAGNKDGRVAAALLRRIEPQ